MKHLTALFTTFALIAVPAAAQDELGDFLEATAAETVPVEQPAADAPIAVSALKKAGGTPPAFIDSPEEVAGLKELQALGAQGEPTIDFVIRADGSITDIVVSKSTGSPELDAVAVALVGQFTAQPGRDAAGNPVDVAAEMPLNFWKDSLAKGQLGEKTCAEFLIDADWHLAMFPDQTIKDMRIWKLTLGAAVLVHPDSFAFKKPTPQDVYDNCQKKPKAGFFKTFMKDA
ncbi:TonB family protein [Erythrobacter insulae]|nr:TonB family protein [Erythrobacter insulae]